MAQHEIREMWLTDTKRPWRAPYLALVSVRIGKEQILCDTPRRSHLYGTSAFGTQEAALRSCYGRMAEFVNSFWNQRFAYENWAQCVALLKARRGSQ